MKKQNNNKPQKRGNKGPKDQTVATVAHGSRGGNQPLWSSIRLPQTQQVELRYTTATVISSSIGIGSYVMSMNGLYDPDVTAIGV